MFRSPHLRLRRLRERERSQAMSNNAMLVEMEWSISWLIFYLHWITLSILQGVRCCCLFVSVCVCFILFLFYSIFTVFLLHFYENERTNERTNELAIQIQLLLIYFKTPKQQQQQQKVWTKSLFIYYTYIYIYIFLSPILFSSSIISFYILLIYIWMEHCL